MRDGKKDKSAKQRGGDEYVFHHDVARLAARRLRSSRWMYNSG